MSGKSLFIILFPIGGSVFAAWRQNSDMTPIWFAALGSLLIFGLDWWCGWNDLQKQLETR